MSILLSAHDKHLHAELVVSYSGGRKL